MNLQIKDLRAENEELKVYLRVIVENSSAIGTISCAVPKEDIDNARDLLAALG